MFFERYGQFKRYENVEYPNIDFNKLLEEFSKSATLRKTISWKIVQESYEGIVAGDFRDKVDKQEEGRNYFADIDKHYRKIRYDEIDRVEEIKKKLGGIGDFAKIDKRLRQIAIETVRAEINKDNESLEMLNKEMSLLRAKRRAIIEENGYLEEELNIREFCSKCHDTGFTSSGKICDCYKG